MAEVDCEMECFSGEVDDVIAAAHRLGQRPGVDPDRVYLAGHGTGASIALLAASSTDAFAGVSAVSVSSTALIATAHTF